MSHILLLSSASNQISCVIAACVFTLAHIPRLPTPPTALFQHPNSEEPNHNGRHSCPLRFSPVKSCMLNHFFPVQGPDPSIISLCVHLRRLQRRTGAVEVTCENSAPVTICDALHIAKHFPVSINFRIIHGTVTSRLN